MSKSGFLTSIAELQAVLEDCRELEQDVAAAGHAIVASIQAGGKLLTCGNGGSAADALHLSQELVGCFRVKRRALPAVCLNADSTSITSICNDYGYEQVFARGVEALGKPGDVLVGFSTSGNSANVIAAFRAATTAGLTTILLAGRDGGEARGLCTHEIIVPSQDTARIQEVHTLVLHQWLEALDAHHWPATLP